MNSVLVYFPLFLHPLSDSDEISVSLYFFNIPGNLKGKRTLPVSGGLTGRQALSEG